MKLDAVMRILEKFGFSSEYVKEFLSWTNPYDGFDRLKMELLIRWEEMGKPKELEEDYNRIDKMKLKVVIRDDGKASNPTPPEGITVEEFRRLVTKISGDVNMFCDEMVEGFLDGLGEEQREFLKGAFDSYKCDKKCNK